MAFFLKEGLIGYIPDLVTKFTGNDSEEKYLKNLETQSNDWYYRNNEISYVYNEHGHRCKNIKNLNFDNYILFLGCSHTEGVGNRLEDTYPYLLSKKFNVDYYNLALGGCASDTARHNLTVWLAKFPLPKYIIWQWPPKDRFLIKEKTDFRNIGPWELDKEKRNLLALQSTEIFETRDILIAEYLNQLKNLVPLFQIGFPNYHMPSNTDISLVEIMDQARDLMHYGRLTQEGMASMLEDKIINT